MKKIFFVLVGISGFAYTVGEKDLIAVDKEISNKSRELIQNVANRALAGFILQAYAAKFCMTEQTDTRLQFAKRYNH